MYSILTACLFFLQSSLYDLHITLTEGTEVSLSTFQGKKILLVNIATSSPFVDQFSGLEQLQETYKDSLIVIVFPSNSFGQEQKRDSAISAFCKSTYNNSFLIAHAASVKGADIQPVYNWLTNQTENGVMQGEVKTDFQKYLISSDGRLVGVFAGSVDPMDK